MSQQSPAPLDPPLIDDRPSLRFALEVGGSTLAVRSYEPIGAPAATILAIHGFRGDHHGLRRIVNALPRHRFVIPDLPGFGDSGPFAGERAPAHDLTGHGMVIEALRTALELPADTVLLGHSYGSVVTSHYLAAHPGTFSRLVLINPICEPALEGSAAITTKLAEFYYAAGAFLPGRLGEAILRSRLIVDATTAAMVTSSDPATRAYVKTQHRAYFAGFSSPATLLESYRASVAHTVLEVAAAIEAPTLLVAGSADPLGSVRGQEILAETFPHAELEMIQGVGHLIHYETPGTAAAAIERFLA
ncbi:alpha/beta fold hydrolase [Galactobacter valiniphilus]|uniref:alpha/beta fold hydrolase n=1 Tax=Galactobacter valiniphilus TaxID=2676122 RepID=UPI003735847C